MKFRNLSAFLLCLLSLTVPDIFLLLSKGRKSSDIFTINFFNASGSLFIHHLFFVIINKIVYQFVLIWIQEYFYFLVLYRRMKICTLVLDWNSLTILLNFHLSDKKFCEIMLHIFPASLLNWVVVYTIYIKTLLENRQIPHDNCPTIF